MFITADADKARHRGGVKTPHCNAISACIQCQFCSGCAVATGIIIRYHHRSSGIINVDHGVTAPATLGFDADIGRCAESKQGHIVITAEHQRHLFLEIGCGGNVRGGFIATDPLAVRPDAAAEILGKGRASRTDSQACSHYERSKERCHRITPH